MGEPPFKRQQRKKSTNEAKLSVRDVHREPGNTEARRVSRRMEWLGY